MKKIEGYVLNKEIGHGQFGKVYLAEKTSSAKTIGIYWADWALACKVIPKAIAKKNKRLEKYIHNEIDIMLNIQSDNVINLVDAKMTPNNYYLFTYFYNGPDLRKLVDAKGGCLIEK